MNINEIWNNFLFKFGTFCRKMKENNQTNINRIKSFFENTKNKFDEGFINIDKDGQEEYFDEDISNDKDVDEDNSLD